MFGVVFSSSGFAAEDVAVQTEVRAPAPMNLKEELSALNRIKPLQNPKLKKSASILGRSVIDRTSRIVGKVEDLILTKDGLPSSLSVSFDRLRLQQPVFLNFTDTKITVVSNGYKVGYEGAEIQAYYPELLAGIETAAGATGLLSLRTVLGKSVVTSEKNAVMGEITDILMDEDGTKALGFYMKLRARGFNEQGIAVPFAAVTFEDGPNGVLRGRMNEADMDTVLKFAKK